MGVGDKKAYTFPTAPYGGGKLPFVRTTLTQALLLIRNWKGQWNNGALSQSYKQAKDSARDRNPTRRRPGFQCQVSYCIAELCQGTAAIAGPPLAMSLDSCAVSKKPTTRHLSLLAFGTGASTAS